MQKNEALIDAYDERLRGVRSDTDTVTGLLDVDLYDVPSRNSESTATDRRPLIYNLGCQTL